MAVQTRNVVFATILSFLAAFSVYYQSVFEISRPHLLLNASNGENNNTEKYNSVYRDPCQHTDIINEKFPYQHGSANTSDISVIFYNRIEKTGSEATTYLLKALSPLNHVHFVFDVKIVKQHNQSIHMFSSKEKEVAFVREVLNSKKPMLYVKHLYFMNFTKYASKVKTVYINLVRDPVERAISGYNYKRFRTDRPHKMTTADRLRSMDDCVTQKAAECSAPQYRAMYVRFFCGTKPVCLKVHEGALQLAKRNIEQHYLVVGMLEELDDFYRVLQSTLPRYFKGIFSLFQKRNSGAHKKDKSNKTVRKQTLSNSTRAIFKDRLKYDYNLYEFIRQRFHTTVQLLKCQNKLNTTSIE